MYEVRSELALKVAILLGISPMNRPAPCHGYANGCICSECGARRELLARAAPAVRQPWERAAA